MLRYGSKFCVLPQEQRMKNAEMFYRCSPSVVIENILLFIDIFNNVKICFEILSDATRSKEY